MPSYSQKRAREVILSKSSAHVRRSRAGHDTGFIYIRGVLVARVKIPNAHNDTMGKGLCNKIARSLRLSNDDFATFMDCSMKAADYLEHLARQEGK